MQPWMIGTPFAVLGIVALGIAVWLFTRDGAIKNWPTTDGVITSSKLETNSPIQVKDRFNNWRSYESSMPKVRYTYTVDGKQLEGSRITREPRADDHGDAVVARYPVGKTVKVYYDAKDPASSVLEAKTSIGGVILAIIGGFFVVFGAAMFVGMKLLMKSPS
jgi:Protein of unknown function (DUF3592)